MIDDLAWVESDPFCSTIFFYKFSCSWLLRSGFIRFFNLLIKVLVSKYSGSDATWFSFSYRSKRLSYYFLISSIFWNKCKSLFMSKSLDLSFFSCCILSSFCSYFSLLGYGVKAKDFKSTVLLLNRIFIRLRSALESSYCWFISIYRGIFACNFC